MADTQWPMDPAHALKAMQKQLRPEMSEQDKEFLKKYGKLPPKKGVAKKLLNKGGERKYFDSGDYMLSQAGKTSEKVPTAVPTPETIPHPTEKVQPKRPSHLTE